MRSRTTGLGLAAGVLLAFNAWAAEPGPAEPVPAAAEIGKLMLTAETWTDAQVNALARFVRAPRYVFVPADRGPVFYESGNPMLMLGADYGRVYEVGDSTRRGVFWNFSRDPAIVRIGDSPETTQLPSGSLLIVGDVLVQDDAERTALNIGSKREWMEFTHRASAKCGPGYYACCMINSGGITMTAECIAYDIPNAPECDSGGPGATACAIWNN